MIKFYTIDCPRCLVLEKKLNAKGIEFEKITDFDKDEFINEGRESMPLLNVNDEWYDFKKANEWINNQ